MISSDKETPRQATPHLIRDWSDIVTICIIARLPLWGVPSLNPLRLRDIKIHTLPSSLSSAIPHKTVESPASASLLCRKMSLMEERMMRGAVPLWTSIKGQILELCGFQVCPVNRCVKERLCKRRVRQKRRKCKAKAKRAAPSRI